MRERIFWLLICAVVGGALGNRVGCGAELPRELILKPTTAAPAGAQGSAEFQLSGPTTARARTLVIQTRGLSPGKYRIAIISKANGTSSPLGLVTLGNSDVTPDVEAGDSKNQDSSTHATQGVKNRIEIQLPAELNDIGGLTLADAGGTVLLRGEVGSGIAQSR